MRRFRVPEIVFGFLLATIFWVAVAIIYPKYYGGENGSKKGAPQISIQEAEVETNRRIADYNRTLDLLTALLVGANLALWWATWRGGVRQSRDMRLGTMAARRSANAAVRAAENAEKALHSLEVPHVYPVELKFSIFEDPHHVPLIAIVSASLKNFGRSPAFLKELYLIVAVTRLERKVGERPLFHSGRIPFMADDIIGDKETIGPFEKNIPELVPYCNQIRDGSLRLGLLVNHRIDDALKDTFGRGAWYVWNPKRQKFVAGVQLWSEN